MGADETKTPLRDYLYRDPSRVASYYAQLHGGHLTGMEKSGGNKQTTEIGGGASLLGALKGDHKRGKEFAEAFKETLSPHDIITNDLIARLIADGRVRGDHHDAGGNTIVRATGTLFLIDGAIIPLALSAFLKTLPAATTHKKPNATERAAAKAAADQIRVIEIARTAFEKIEPPSAFVIESEDGSRCIGMIKAAGLDEPISSFCFKHGANGIPDVSVIGIKETSCEAAGAAETVPLLSASKLFSHALGAMMFDSVAVRLTPLVIYRDV